MTSAPTKPSLKPRQFKLGTAWFISIEWPDGVVHQVGGFVSEVEAQCWINERSGDVAQGPREDAKTRSKVDLADLCLHIFPCLIGRCLAEPSALSSAKLSPILRQIKGSEKMGEPKTAQPFSDEIKDTSSPGTGTEPKPRPDAVDDPKKKEESPKTTQRTE